ncbi:aldehyde dehydrogenase family protein [Hyphobacterium sp. HN65]|uniref:Aldehyde dehydrogenase n=1 Tax=Hyphobacterium lacteum TaxID=3116575 RepID=A0ABU7LPR1_9PROT|nr:aldehyde dehydrogenase family protein [Hyphobacterium sp. HN65]MEE2525594.1 aldehyde dehydrogenase family protein [Hyphobacterium sp. HN65]
MSDLDSKQIERMSAVFQAQKAAFEGERHRAYKDRIRDIDAIAALTVKHAEAIKDAAASDFGVRSRCETQLSEIAYMASAAKHTRRHLNSWMQKKKVAVPGNLKPGNAYIRREPKGVVGIISPWNYPFQLAFSPILAALAAGCRVMLKPSEFTPAMSDLMKSMLAEEFDENHVAVILGGPAVGEAFTKLPYDHLFYTGSTHVGRIVSKAAAENLTPVTLELGGKSPVIMADDFPAEKAGETLAFGKFLNAGQTCIAPDYVLTPKGKSRTVAESTIARVQKAYPDWATDEDYTAVVSDKHYERLNSMIEEARSAGAEILQAEGSDPGNARKIAPTVVLNPPEDSRLMQEEIFGPVLPILEHDGLDDAMKRVNAKDRPLALYVYAKSKKTARSVLEGTISGGAVVNNTMLHYSVEDLPFGGVGASGSGAYHGEYGFETFTHARSVFETPVWHPSRLIQPPYGKIFDMITKT